jgi:hypothetical protein
MDAMSATIWGGPFNESGPSMAEPLYPEATQSNLPLIGRGCGWGCAGELNRGLHNSTGGFGVRWPAKGEDWARGRTRPSDKSSGLVLADEHRQFVRIRPRGDS